MSGYTDSSVHRDAERRPLVPAYGPVDAALGFGLLYLVFERVTPAVVDVFTAAVDVSASTVELGLAMFLWFVFAVTTVDQLRRQLAALGVVDAEREWRLLPEPETLSNRVATWYLAMALAGGLFAAWAFDRAMATLVSLIELVGGLDTGAFVFGEFLLLAGFFLAFAVATHAIDRLVVGGVRTLLAA